MKRWERGILSAQDDAAASAPAEPHARSAALVHRLERAFGLEGLADGSLLRQGLGFPGAHHRSLFEDAQMAAEEGADGEGEGEGEGDGHVERNAYVFSLDSANPANNDRIARAYADEARLHQDLRSAGLL